MYFDLDDEQEAFVATVREFAAREIAPGAVERDRGGEWFAEGWRKMGQLGLLGLQFPEAYGGSDASIVTTAAAFEAFTAGGADAGIALSWVAHSVLAGTPIWLFGTGEQKRRYLAKIASGERTAGYGLTEPNAGSDAAALQTVAVRKGSRWILNGSKMFITNAQVGDLFVVFASEDRSLGSRGITAFIVEKTFPGFSTGRELDKMGNRTSPTGELIFTDCEVPEENVLGQSRQGFTIAKAALEWERFLMMAHSVGTMDAMVADSARYAADRKQFGKPIGDQPAIQWKLAEMRLAADVGRLFVRRVAWMKDQGLATPVESSTCKIYCSAAVMQATIHAVQLHGGFGYIRESSAERAMRDAKLAGIGGGTTEIQRQVVGRSVLHGDNGWDLAYTPDQLAARGQPPASAGDLVGACLALARLAGESPTQALLAMAREVARRSLTEAGQARALGGRVATYALRLDRVIGARSAELLLVEGRLLDKHDWEVESELASTARLQLPLARVRLSGSGAPVDTSGLASVSRLLLGAVAVGLAEAVLKRTLERVAHDRAKSEAQLVQHRLADMRTQLDAARMAVHRAAVLMDRGDVAPEAATQARIVAIETAAFCAEQGYLLVDDPGEENLTLLSGCAGALALLDEPPEEDRLWLARRLLAAEGRSGPGASPELPPARQI